MEVLRKVGKTGKRNSASDVRKEKRTETNTVLPKKRLPHCFETTSFFGKCLTVSDYRDSIDYKDSLEEIP